jgi:RNA polymerase sigma-70 factor (ECF subfamily)
MQEIERELITRAGGGDMGAFREIYQRFSGYVYTLAYRIVSTKHDAEEVTQDVFLKIHRSLGAFKFESSFKTWLYRIAVNAALNHAKKRSRVTMREVEEVFEDPATVTQPDASKGIEAREAGQQLKILLDQLNPDQRACIVLREIEGLDYQGIARSLGTNINTVRSRLKRARETLLTLGQAQFSIQNSRDNWTSPGNLSIGKKQMPGQAQFSIQNSRDNWTSPGNLSIGKKQMPGQAQFSIQNSRDNGISPSCL